MIYFIQAGAVISVTGLVYCKSSPPIREKMRREKGREKEQRI